MSENTNNEKEESLVIDDVNDIEESLETTVEEVEDIKVEEAKPQPEAIVAPEPAVETPGLAYVADGVLGSTKVTKAEKKPAAKKTTKKEDIVAVYSSRNVTWNGVGKVYTGYNIVSKAAAEQWLKRDHVRLATPEEVAREYGQ